MRKVFLWIFITIALIAFSYQWETLPGFFKPLRNLAMGGTYVTSAQGVESLMLNPALFEPRGVISLDLHLSNNVATIAPKLFELLKNPENISQLATDTQFLNAVQGVHTYGVNVYGGYGSRIVWANVGGLGGFQSELFWNLSLMNLNEVELGAWAAYFGVVGGSMNVMKDLKVGVSVGGGMAGRIVPATGTSYPAKVDMMDENSLNSVLPDVSKLFSYINSPFFVFNAGAIYNWNDLSVGIAFHYNSNNVLKNAPSQILSAGISYDLKILKIVFELEDLLNQEKSFYRKTNLGLQSDFGFLRLYGGLHAGWLTGGMELDVPFFNVVFSAHVIEFSPSAGLMGEPKYSLSFRAKF